MKTATGLTLIAVGAILAFAVSARPPGVNLQVVGFIIMAAGVIGFVLPGRAHGWLRRRIVVHGPLGASAAGRTADLSASPGQDYPAAPYLADDPDQDPLLLASQVLGQAELLDAVRSARAGQQEHARPGQDQDAAADAGQVSSAEQRRRA